MTTDPHRDAPLLQGVQGSVLALTSVGRYGLRKVLGTGPSGTVYVGFDPEEGTNVAVNLMAAVDAGHEEVARTCVAAEAEAWGRVHHPNLVRVHDVGYYRDPRNGRTGVYVVRELVPGIDLQRWLASRPRFDGTKAWLPLLDMFVPIGLALAKAHHYGLVHRRFSPASVVVNYDGGVKLLDFGTFHAAPLDPSQVAPEHYPAPEQAWGAPASAWSDQYSFCAAIKVALHRATDGRIPSSVLRILDRGLEADPKHRWPNMLELCRALVRCRPWWHRPITAAFTAAAAGTALAFFISSAA